MPKTEEYKELIYLLMMGEYDYESYPVPESTIVENEFEEGKYCERLYSEIFDLSLSISKRLNSDNDEEVEKIKNNFFLMMNYLCKQMYSYGEQFQSEKNSDYVKILTVYDKFPEEHKKAFMKLIELLSKR